MFKNVPVSISRTLSDGNTVTLETGLLAAQATSSVLAKVGDTAVLAAVVVGNDSDMDYFPLQVVYEERFYASGKMKNSLFSKREARPTDRAVLVGRVVDRSLRSLFNPNIRTSIQVVLTALSVLIKFILLILSVF
jgi:polyribonucleotide nucleotidyltransferase